MKSLSQSDFADFRNLYESMYTPKEELQINEELIDEVFDELVEEFIEEGYTEEDAIEIVDEAIDIYIDEVLCEASDSYYDSAVRASKKAAQGIDKAARQKRRAGQVRYAKRKAGEALKAAGDKVKGAVAGAQIAGSIAKDETRRAGRKAAHAVTSAPGKAKAAVDRKKKGIKGFIKRQAQKVVNRMSEELEPVAEDSRRMSNKQHSARVRSNIKSFGSNYTPPSNYDPDANRGQGEVLTRKQIEKKRRKALRQEEVEVDEAMSSYDRNRKRAAQRAAARNAARDAGKTGVVPGVGYVTPRRERETYVDSAGTTRHKSGARMEELEATGLFSEKEIEAIMEAEMIDENRRAARAAGGYKDDSKKQPDPSKDGFTGVGNMSIDAIRKMSARIEKKNKK
jgi:hypothetical protein